MTTTYETQADFERAKVAIKTDNPRLCLSALRYFGRCYKCPVFRTAKGKVCESALIVKDKMLEVENLQAERQAVKAQLAQIDAKLEQVKK